MRRAFHALRNGPPGPVVVEMLTDVCDQVVPAESALDYRPPQLMRQVPAQADIDEAVKMLLQAEKPVIWAGGGVLLGERQLTRCASWPSILASPFSAPCRANQLSTSATLSSLGAGSRATTLPAHRWLQECDLLLAIGTSLTRGPYCQIILPGKFIIHNTVDPEDINKDESVDIGLVGDAMLTLQAMLRIGQGPGWRGPRRTQPPRDCRRNRRLHENRGWRSGCPC